MIETRVSLPELAVVAGTRAILGFGVGLLLADRWADDQRRAIGWSAFLIGAISTVPLALEVLGHRIPTSSSAGRSEPSKLSAARRQAEDATLLTAASC